MIGNNSAFAILRLALIALIGSGLLVLGYIYLMDPFAPDTADMEKRIALERYQATAGIFRGRTGSYDGVCSGFVLPDDITCDDDANTYALETKTETGEYLCVDSTGYVGVKVFSRQNDLSCPR